jgi:phosphate-selective porin OprO/OprP
VGNSGKDIFIKDPHDQWQGARGAFRITVGAVFLFLFACISSVGQTSQSSVTPAAKPTPFATPTPVRVPSPTPAPELDDDPDTAPTSTTTPKDKGLLPPRKYFLRDVAKKLVITNNKYFSLQMNFGVLADFTFLGQDEKSKDQVGPQASKFDLRAARVVLAGFIKFKKPWTYFFMGDVNELRKEGDRVMDALDMWVSIPLWKKARVRIGKQKEPFIYEMVGDSATLPQSERILNAFFETRNVGVRYMDNWAKDRMSFSIGVYNDWFQNGNKFSRSGTQVSSRLTGLPFESEDKKTFLHLGVAYRYNGADAGKMRFKARPESNITDYYVDTGSFEASHSNAIALEALYNRKSFSVLTEYVKAYVQSPRYDNPSFSGTYVIGSYILTGETRPYDKLLGYARRIVPESRWGAVELVGRFGYVDLDDRLIQGGKLKKWYFGVNWWASAQWKFSTGYGIADLNRFGTIGRTTSLISRIQWIY